VKGGKVLDDFVLTAVIIAGKCCDSFTLNSTLIDFQVWDTYYKYTAGTWKLFSTYNNR
jgi:hypothetical protein